MRALEFITGHVTYNPAYTYKFQLKNTQVHSILVNMDVLLQFLLEVAQSTYVLNQFSNHKNKKNKLLKLASGAI